MLEMWHFKTAYVVDALASLLLSKKSDWMHSLVMNNWWLWRFAKGWSVFDAKHSKTVNISSVSNTFHGQIVGWSSIPRLWTAEECDTQGGLERIGGMWYSGRDWRELGTRFFHTAPHSNIICSSFPLWNHLVIRHLVVAGSKKLIFARDHSQRSVVGHSKTAPSWSAFSSRQ